MEGPDETASATHHDIPHYHGDTVRGLFLFGAIVLVVAQSTGADLPVSTTGAVLGAVILAVAAGITNPRQRWIHWCNALIAIYGTLVFGTAAIDHYRNGYSFFDASFLYTEAIAIIAIVALYFATRTIRGLLLRPKLS